MSTPVVECLSVSKSFAVKRGGRRYDIKAVDNVSLSFHAAKTVGVVGESGSGKSTLGRIVAALLPPSSGEVLVDGASTAPAARSSASPARRPA